MTARLLESAPLVTHALKFGGHELAVSNFAADRLINDELERTGVWESWQLALMGRLIKPNFTCVDIGSNIGINAMFMAKLCPRGRVIAFEPFDAIYNVLSENVRQNHLDNLTATNKGISDAAGMMHMIVSPSAVGGAHIAEPDAGAGDAYATGTFQFVRIDEELQTQGITKVDLMKVDVEGHELEVLAGATPFLADPDLQLIIEFNPRELGRMQPAGTRFPDRSLFEKLQTHFRHIFFMGRDNTLFEVKSYHALRRKLLGGHFVDDLYCANTIRPEIADLIVTGPPASPKIRSSVEKLGGITIHYANRDADAWGIGDSLNPATVSAQITGACGRQLSLKFRRIHAHHLPANSPAIWPVWILLGSELFVLDIYEASRELSFSPDSDCFDITIQSQYQTPASLYLGNPNEQRQLGFRFWIRRFGVMSNIIRIARQLWVWSIYLKR